MSNEEESPSASPVAIVGAGAVGTALARRLHTSGTQVAAILSRDASDARALAKQVGATVGTNVWTELPKTVRLALLCVPDDAIPTVADALSTVDHPWERTVVGHTSGARTAEALAPLAERGAAVFSFHPLQTFTRDTPPDAFEDIVIAIEGDDDAVSVGRSIGHSVGARPMVLSARDKVLYHCAAALASNGLVALMGAVRELLSEIDGDISRESATDLMAPLVDETWANLRATTPEDALTGPVARNDHATIDAHLEALSTTHLHLVPLYAALSSEMARIAHRGNQLERPSTEEILKTLLDALQKSIDGTDSTGPLH